ncbi:MAG: lysylphosphatidylglycerol synthase transmembrane domain-containing protein [Mariprofundaceae bacterium]
MYKLIFKIAFSAFLLVVLFFYIDINAVLARLQQVNYLWLVLACAMLLVGQVLSAIRWAWLARGLGLTVRTSRKIQLYFLGMFLSLFLPSIIGGDVARGFLLAHGRENAGWKAAGSVILERISGLLMLTALTTVCMFATDIPESWRTIWLLAVVALWIGMLSYPFWHHRLPRLLHRWRGLPIDQPRFISAWWRGMVLSMVFQILVIATTMLLGYAAGLEMSWAAYGVMVGLVAIASTAPISFNGFGIREAGYVSLAAYFGGNPEAAAVMAALWVIVLAVVAAPGAWVLWQIGGTAALKNKA